MKNTWPGILLLALACSCQSGGGGLEPIVIDLSHRVPSATPTPSPSAPGPPAGAAAMGSVPTPPPFAVAQRPPAAVSGPEQLVDKQLDAFNRHDLETFLATYAPDATLFDQPDHVRQSGIGEIRQTYGLAFASNPALRAMVSARMAQANVVVDQETVTGFADGKTVTAVVIYEVADDKIRRVWFIR